jgi:hypothetical protein
MRSISLVAALLIIAQHTAAVGGEAQPKAEAPGTDETLSDRLNKDKGVVKPKQDIDPKLLRPAPEVNPKSTPVIPPPNPNGK